MKPAYLIYSKEESKNSDEPLFWSNKSGWTLIEGAAHFTKLEKEIYNLPMGGEWVTMNRTKKIVDIWQKKIDALDKV